MPRKSQITASSRDSSVSSRPGSALAKLGKRNHEARDRALSALSAIRNGATLSRAVRENGITPRTIRRYVGTELLQDHPGGRIRATKTDRLVRYLLFPGPNGPIEKPVRGSKAASDLARYKAAVSRFLRGDADAMAEWHGKKIAGVALITASNSLKNLADKGLLPYSLYRSFSGGAL